MLRLALLSALAVSCAGPQKPAAVPSQLRTVVEPAHATVQVDEQFIGTARVLDKRPAVLKPGKHRVTIEAPGFFPHDLEVVLAPGVTKLELKLRPVPP